MLPHILVFWTINLRLTALRTLLSRGFLLGSLVEERIPVPQLLAKVFLQGNGVNTRGQSHQQAYTVQCINMGTHITNRIAQHGHRWSVKVGLWQIAVVLKSCTELKSYSRPLKTSTNCFVSHVLILTYQRMWLADAGAILCVWYRHIDDNSSAGLESWTPVYLCSMNKKDICSEESHYNPFLCLWRVSGSLFPQLVVHLLFFCNI